MLFPNVLVGLSLALSRSAWASAIPITDELEKRAVNDTTSQLNAVAAGASKASLYQDVFSVLNQIKPTATPTTIARKFPYVCQGK
jgi:hypothetical protein